MVEGFEGGGEFGEGEGLIAVDIEFLQKMAGHDIGGGWSLGAVAAVVV